MVIGMRTRLEWLNSEPREIVEAVGTRNLCSEILDIRAGVSGGVDILEHALYLLANMHDPHRLIVSEKNSGDLY
jgi:hypothetical protein